MGWAHAQNHWRLQAGLAKNGKIVQREQIASAEAGLTKPGRERCRGAKCVGFGRFARRSGTASSVCLLRLLQFRMFAQPLLVEHVDDEGHDRAQGERHRRK